jgi:hypothetical protein
MTMTREVITGADVPSGIGPYSPAVRARYVVQAWPIRRDGRKLNTDSALLEIDGRPCATARAVWIERRESHGPR